MPPLNLDLSRMTLLPLKKNGWTKTGIKQQVTCTNLCFKTVAGSRSPETMLPAPGQEVIVNESSVFNTTFQEVYLSGACLNLIHTDNQTGRPGQPPTCLKYPECICS